MRVENLEDIFRIIKDKWSVLQNYRVCRIGVFGSFVHNSQRDNSDVDVLVEFESDIGYFEFFSLKSKLEEWFSRPVDLLSIEAIHPEIKEKVLHETLYAA